MSGGGRRVIQEHTNRCCDEGQRESHGLGHRFDFSFVGELLALVVQGLAERCRLSVHRKTHQDTRQESGVIASSLHPRQAPGEAPGAPSRAQELVLSREIIPEVLLAVVMNININRTGPEVVVQREPGG